MHAPGNFALSVRGQAALQYAIERGWAVFPVWWIESNGHCACGRAVGHPKCKPGKHPIGRLVPRGHKDASKDPTQIRSWWEQCPNANIGVAMGDASGVFAIDLDGAKGHKILGDVRRDNDATLREPLMSQSGRGPDGHHLIYNVPPGRRLGRVLRRDLSVDIIGNGGYIIAPPSNHISGGTCQWINVCAVSNPEPWLMQWVWSLFDKAGKDTPSNVVPFDRPGTPNVSSRARLADSLCETLSAPPPYSEYEDAKLRSALAYKDATGKRVWDPNAGYEIWGETVAPAIASLGWGKKGEDIFVDWSRLTTVDGLFPGEEACHEKIRSYKRGRVAGCVTEGTIYKAVRDAGWKEPAPQAADTETNSGDGDGHAGSAPITSCQALR
jgi:Bifunctional DNA primase/polymerase, N-terminal